uniref:N-terminal EF-hand calcium binding protein 3 n=1 Tax=Sinocyclocheilus anshuiensis TaxID=1608454 RepID=A0A671S1W7_9TELE
MHNDGKLSFEEFKAYFADGILTTDELRELFYSIDGRQTNNLDTDKLSDYFSQHLGEYLDVLSALEKLNVAVLKAMDKTKEEYQGSSVLGQFVTRFMLRETSSQLLSLQMSLQCAMDAVEAQSIKVPEHLIIQKNNRRCGRRVQKNMCLSPTDPYSDTDEHWCSQINRLQQLIDKLECQVNTLKYPLTQNILSVLSMCFNISCSKPIFICFSFLESKVGAAERRYTGQHVQVGDPCFISDAS